ncbi:aminotransferase class IV [Thalassospira australica]|uniref:aminotransferase class IV n=1 Tax=Thalassospira australica TaxID=1528106 RepID=UPI00385112FE
MKAWLNGKIIERTDAHIAISDRGLLLGDGFFETMRAHDGKVAWLSRHLERLNSHAEMIGLDPVLLPNADETARAVTSLWENLDGSDAVIRLTVTRGSGPRAVLPPTDCNPTILMTAASFAKPLPDNGLVLATSKSIRRNPWSVASRIKSLNYLDNIVARREVAAYGADEALILSVDGSVGETTIANLFAVRDGVFYTPASDCGILAGLARQFVIDWCRANDLVVHLTSIDPADLASMDVVFICNALQGIRFVRTVDGVSFDLGRASDSMLVQLAGMLEKSLCLGIEF